MPWRKHVFTFIFSVLWFSLWWVLFFTILPHHVPLWRSFVEEPKPVTWSIVNGAVVGALTYPLYILLKRLFCVKS
jgi:predicted secreted protein